MRVLLAAVFIAFAAPLLTSAQALNPEIIFGRDYTFERMQATRKVHGAVARASMSISRSTRSLMVI